MKAYGNEDRKKTGRKVKAYPPTELLPVAKSFVTFDTLATKFATMKKMVTYVSLYGNERILMVLNNNTGWICTYIFDLLLNLSECVFARVAFIVQLLDALSVC